MVTATKQRARVTLNYSGNSSRPYSYSGLIPECSDSEAYSTAMGINAVQAQAADKITKTVESKLEDA